MRAHAPVHAAKEQELVRGVPEGKDQLGEEKDPQVLIVSTEVQIRYGLLPGFSRSEVHLFLSDRRENHDPYQGRNNRDEVFFFFAAERAAKKNAHALRAGLDRKTFSSAISVSLAKRAVRKREVY